MAERIGFIGAGNMATAIAQGVLKQGGATTDEVRCSDVSAERLDWVSKTLGINTTTDNNDLVGWADIVVLAVKPQVLDLVLAGCNTAFRAGQLVISVCAGVTLEKLRGALKEGVQIARAMPNTPALVSAGATALSFDANVSAPMQAAATAMFEAVGDCVSVDERYLDAVTGLAGSGPAYIMLVIESMADGGVKAGLPRALAHRLAVQTVLGAAKLVQETGTHPAVLKDQVASPGGTTITGVATLEAAGLRSAFISAVCAAADRAKALAG